jgi:predicted phage terminase large subunit-like protein
MDMDKLLTWLCKTGGDGSVNACRDAIQVCKNMESEKSVEVVGRNERTTTVYDDKQFAKAHEWIKKVRSACLGCIRNGGGEEAVDLYYQTHLFDARFSFDSFMLFIEHKRPKEQQYWLPRRKKLLFLAQALEDLEFDRLDELFLSMPPRTGKSTLIMFFMLWVMLRDSERPNLYCSYTESVVEIFYNGLLEVLNDPYTYDWKTVFPQSSIASTNAKDKLINLDRRKRYSSITCRSLWGALNGSCDVSKGGYVVGDDLISGIEEALSKDRLDHAYFQVTNNLLARDATGTAKKLWIGTRWAQSDPIGRRIELLENDGKFNGYRWKIVCVPALNSQDESNFDYDYGIGITTEAYHKVRAGFERNNDMASWFAQYMGTPVDRVGAVFEPDDLRYYNGELPGADPDRIFMAVDPAWGGGDYVAAPVCYQYGDDFYVHDVVYNNGDKTVTWPLIVSAIENNGVQAVGVEATKATSSYTEGINERLKQKGIHINVQNSVKNWTGTGKDQRILDKAPDIRQHMVFRDSGCRSREYERFMQNLYSFKFLQGQAARKQSDDAPDSLAQALSMAYYAPAKVVLLRRSF